MASFHSAAFPDSLAIAKEESMTIGSIDQIQKLHIRTVPLHEQPRRIVHQEATRTFGVLTVGAPQPSAQAQAAAPAGSSSSAAAAAAMAEGAEASYLRVLDDTTFDVVASYALDAQEMGWAICSTSLGSDPAVYYVVGTAVSAAVAAGFCRLPPPL